jgi:hypothetical protein
VHDENSFPKDLEKTEIIQIMDFNSEVCCVDDPPLDFVPPEILRTMK